MDPKELLRKAATVVSDLGGVGVLNPEQANAFIDMMQKDTVLTREARNEKMTAPKENFNKLGFSARIMQPATEATDPGSESSPATDQVQLVTKEGIAIVQLSYNVFEDNIERGALADHIVRLIAERAGVDLEEQYVMGDEAGTGDAWLQQNDGVLALATSHVADASTLTDPTDVIAACDAAYKLLPKKYLRNKRQWRYYVHEDLEHQTRMALSERATVGGDNFLLTDTPVLVRGIPMVALPAIASRDLDGAGAGTAIGSDILLAHPQNVVIGVQRNISIENMRLIRARVVEYVATIRSDVEFETEDAVAKAIKVQHA